MIDFAGTPKSTTSGGLSCRGTGAAPHTATDARLSCRGTGAAPHTATDARLCPRALSAFFVLMPVFYFIISTSPVRAH